MHAVAILPTGERGLDIGGSQHLVAFHRQQDVAGLHARTCGATRGGHASRHHAHGRVLPEDAVVEQAEGCLEDDVVDAESGQDESDRPDSHVLAQAFSRHDGPSVTYPSKCCAVAALSPEARSSS